MALLSTKSHLVSTAGGLLNWFTGGETSEKIIEARRSILRDPSHPSPRKQQCFYASPVTGGPVESVHRYEHPSPSGADANFNMAEMEPQKAEESLLENNPNEQIAQDLLHQPDAMRKSPIQDARSRAFLRTPIARSSRATSGLSSTSEGSQDLLSDDDHDGSPAKSKWHVRRSRYNGSLRRSRQGKLPMAAHSSDNSSRETSPARRSLRKSASDNFLPFSARLAESRRRSSYRQRAGQDQFYDTLAKLQIESEEEQAAVREKKRLEAEAEREAVAAAEWARRAYRIVPSKPVIAPLTDDWEKTLAEAMDSAPTKALATAPDGNTLTRRDFGTLYPQMNTNDNSSGWLNDEIINTSMQHIIAYALEQTEHKRGTTPKFHAFASQFYHNLSLKGPQSIARWSKRAKIGGTDLLNVDYVFIPVNPGVHWTLLVVMPSRKLVEYFDSYHGAPEEYLGLAQNWLEMELGSHFTPDEWIFRAGISPTQTNAKDCGVYLVTTAKMVMLGLDPEKAYCERDLTLQRKRIACELINGGFSGDFEPAECGKPGVVKGGKSRRGSVADVMNK